MPRAQARGMFHSSTDDLPHASFYHPGAGVFLPIIREIVLESAVFNSWLQRQTNRVFGESNAVCSFPAVPFVPVQGG